MEIKEGFGRPGPVFMSVENQGQSAEVSTRNRVEQASDVML